MAWHNPAPNPTPNPTARTLTRTLKDGGIQEGSWDSKPDVVPKAGAELWRPQSEGKCWAFLRADGSGWGRQKALASGNLGHSGCCWLGPALTSSP